MFHTHILCISRLRIRRSSSARSIHILHGCFCFLCVLKYTGASDTNIQAGFLKWISQLYRNQGSFFFKPEPLDWSEQIVVITGGTTLISCIGRFHDLRRI